MLWVRVIKALFGDQGGFDNAHSRVKPVGPWSQVTAYSYRLDVNGILYLSTLKKKI